MAPLSWLQGLSFRVRGLSVPSGDLSAKRRSTLRASRRRSTQDRRAEVLESRIVLSVTAQNDTNTYGSNWNTGATGNVLLNDSADGGWDVSPVTWGTMPAGFSGNSDGTYSFSPGAGTVGAFMNGSGITVSYTATAANGDTGTATLSIIPEILEPGESAGGQGYHVVNCPDLVTAGRGNVLAYLDSGGLYVQSLTGTTVFVGASSNTPSTLTVSGPVPTFRIDASNLNFAPVNLPGAYFMGTTNLSMGSVSAGNVAIEANGSIGAVTASSDVIKARSLTGSIGDITAAVDVRDATAMTLNKVEATGGRVWWASAQSIVGEVKAGTSIGTVTAEQTLADKITAVEDITAVYATDIFGKVESTGGSILRVTAQQNISGKIIANGSLGFVHAGNVLSNEVSAGGAITCIDAGSAISGNISSGASIGDVVTNGTETTDAISGTITATGSIEKVESAGAISGAMTANGTVLKVVKAGTTLSGNVLAPNGSINSILAQEITVDQIRAGNNIGPVQAVRTDTVGGNITITTELKAVSGQINMIFASANIDAPIEAGTSIGPITVGDRYTGDLRGSVNAGTSIGPIRALRGSVNSGISAGTNLDSVIALQSITGDLNATAGSIGEITAQQGNIGGTVTAFQNIGDITAGTNIDKDITASNGHIGNFTAGVYNASSSPPSGPALTGDGNITGEIVATNGNIGRVQAHRILSGPMPSFDPIAMAAFQTAFDTWKNTGARRTLRSVGCERML